MVAFLTKCSFQRVSKNSPTDIALRKSNLKVTKARIILARSTELMKGGISIPNAADRKCVRLYATALAECHKLSEEYTATY